jgi:iron complex outermembrane receptor protein
VRKAPLAHFVALAFVASPALAQQPPQEAKKVEKMTVTGTSIKRVQEEGALPLQVITRDQIDRAGITSAEQLMTYISANANGLDNLSSKTLIAGATDVENRNSTANATANLRGLGSGSTLVLLNGRRVALHGMRSAAVDLNSIPMAAVERVEVLKDGASAIYGTDAIGGVINFILRKDYQGVEVTALADMTEEGGGNRYRGSILAGVGDLGKDRYNAMVSFSFDRQERLGGTERGFSNGYQPNRALSPDTAGTPFATQTGAANSAMGSSFTLPGGTQAYTRANLLSFQGNCADRPLQSQYEYVLWATPSFRYACAWDYTAARVLLQPTDTASIVARGTMQLTPELQGFAELTASRTEATNEFEPRQITTSTAAGTNLPAYPVNGPFYQDLSQYIPSFNRNLPIAYRWRCMDCGNRKIEHETTAYRLLAGLEGSYRDWDWRTAVSTGKSEAEATLAGGYYYTIPFRDILASGQLNPWLAPGASQSPTVLAALAAASATGAKLVGGETTLTQFDGSASGEIMQLPAGPLALAAGFDYRREEFEYIDHATTQAIGDAPFDSDLPKVKRTVTAFYGEISAPIVKGLEATLAVRTDDYSDFGRTTNPKASVAWRPNNQVLFRGSWGEGFRAPTFVQLYGLVSEGPVPGNIADPVLCPQNPGNPVYCAIRPNARTGGNPNLEPETSKQWNLGVVVEPLAGLSMSLDYWEVDRDDLIVRLTPQEVIANWTQFPEYLVRGTDGRLDGPGGYIQSGLVNAANEITKGWEVTARYDWLAMNGKWTAAIDGTYIDSYKARIFETQPLVEFAGQWSRRTIYPRWKHTAGLTYTTGPWSSTLINRYVHSYNSEVPPAGRSYPGWDSKVDAYILWDISVTYTGFKNLTLYGGIKNLLDEDPPFSAHATDFVSGAGWDPRVADPRGRAYVLRATYTFK